MRPPSATRHIADERAVSEIMGVTMLLAMVVSTMAGVIVVMQPFMQDLTDNRDWAAGSVAATQFNDRLMVVADLPNGTGIVVNNQHKLCIGVIGCGHTYHVTHPPDTASHHE